MAKTESPSLWSSWSERQFYLSSILTKPLGVGPALMVTADVPDLDYFCGRGGKDMIPIWRNKEANVPNLTVGFAAKLAELLSIATPTVEDVAAYVYALLSCRFYQSHFSEALMTAGLRVPITSDVDLWHEAVEMGRYLLWLHTFAMRFADPPNRPEREVPVVAGIEWQMPVTEAPKSVAECVYNANTSVLSIGNGQVAGVSKEVWDYEVSGFQVVRKWLAYRSLKGYGRATSSKSQLDKTRPLEWLDEWNDELLDLLSVISITLDKQVKQKILFNKICGKPILDRVSFSAPAAEERLPPVTPGEPRLPLRLPEPDR